MEVLSMRMVMFIRSCLQFLVLLCLFGIIGTMGAWEEGNINVLQMLLQIGLLSGMGWVFARASHRRYVIHFLPRKARRALHSSLAQEKRHLSQQPLKGKHTDDRMAHLY